MNKKLISLFLSFFKIGLFTFGGGYAMIPLIQKEISEKRKWIKNKDILDITAISESTPGPIAINMATFVGYQVNGFLGSLFSTLGIVLPSFIIMIFVSFILNKFESNLYVQYAFYGIRIGILSLIIKALISMFKECNKNLFSYLIMIISFGLVIFFELNVIIVIIICAILGILFTTSRKVNKK